MHYPFPILSVVIIGVIILAIIYRKNDRKQKQDMDNFWEREQLAKIVPPKDLDSIEYLKIPIEKFSFGTVGDDETKAIENKITEYSKKRLLNLTGKTNTELRELYGAPNLEIMQEIGDDFDGFSIALNEYAKKLKENECYKEAIPVLEYGLIIKTDISENYIMLADCYKAVGQDRRIETLKEQVMTLGLLMEPSIIAHIDSFLE